MDERPHRAVEDPMGRRTKRVRDRSRTWPRHAQRRDRQSPPSWACRARQNITVSPSTSSIDEGPQAAPPCVLGIQPSPAWCARQTRRCSRRTRSGPANPGHHRNAHRGHLPLAGRRSENPRLPFLRTPEIVVCSLLRTARSDRLALTDFLSAPAAPRRRFRTSMSAAPSQSAEKSESAAGERASPEG